MPRDLAAALTQVVEPKDVDVGEPKFRELEPARRLCSDAPSAGAIPETGNLDTLRAEVDHQLRQLPDAVRPSAGLSLAGIRTVVARSSGFESAGHLSWTR
jgi:hypothetical protein